MLTAINNSKIDISKEESTKELAESFANHLKGGEIIYLHGEMGVGKTTFIRYLINKFQENDNLKTTEVTSPTFSLFNEYQLQKMRINHYDLFRVKSNKEIKDLDIFENNNRSITLIEWPEIIEKKPKNLIELFFKYEKDYLSRSVQIKGLNF